MPKYRFFLLDADNTLFNFDAAEKNAWLCAMASFGLRADDGMYGCYHDINLALWKDYENNLISKSDLVVERHRRMFARYGLSPDPEEFNRRYMPLLAECAEILPGADVFLSKLRSYADAEKAARHSGGIYLITNGVEKTQRKRLADSPLRRYIDDIFVSEAAGAPKPDPLYFDYALSRIPGFERSAAVIVGDSLSSDVKGGNLVGIDTVWFDLYRAGMPDDPPAVPVFTADSYDEILKIITR